MTDDEIRKHHDQMAKIRSLRPAYGIVIPGPLNDADGHHMYRDEKGCLYRVSDSLDITRHKETRTYRTHRQSSFRFHEQTCLTQSSGR